MGRPCVGTARKVWQKFDSEGIMHKELVSTGKTVNGKFCWEVLRRWRSKHPDNWRNISRALHHDNVPAHLSLLVQQFMASTNTTVVLLPHYSPHPKTCDFLLFLKMKLQLTGSRFYSIKEIQTVSQKVMKTLTPNDFRQGFRS